jgi:hypothetical protein
MKRKIILGLFIVVAFAFLALNVRVGYAEPGAAPDGTGYQISWYTIDGGGAQELSGGTYSLSGTIGQPDAGSQSGGTYSLKGGYWISIFGQQYYLPMITK